jgi:hypothetical protein
MNHNSDMKLILENWRQYEASLLQELEDAPMQTVGQLLDVIDAHSKALSDPVKKSFMLLAQLLADVAGFADGADLAPDMITDMAEYITALIQVVLENGIVSKEFLQAGSDIPFGAILKFLKQPTVMKYIILKAGEKTFKEIVGALVPMAKVGMGAIKGAFALFKAVKAGKEIFQQATDPEAAFAGIMQDIMQAEDNKETTAGFLGKFNIDDEWQKMLDDKVEIKYIDHTIKYLRGINPQTSFNDLDFNQRLLVWLKDNFENRGLTSPAVAPG